MRQSLPTSLSAFCLMLAIASFSDASTLERELPDGIGTLDLGHGTRFTDADGFTLYTYDNDLKEPGVSTCVDECAVKYPPLLSARHADDTHPEWSLITRPDNSTQWAYQNMPVHRSSRDSHPSAAYGEGRGWTIVFDPIVTPPGLSVSKTTIGHVLASADGRTLYVRNDDANAQALSCDRECMETWRPLEAPWTTVKSGAFSARVRPDGIHQWSHMDRPLYLYARDAARGDIEGHGIDGAWQALILEPALPNPDWVTVVSSDGGRLFADTKGMTLYTLNVDRNNDPIVALGSNNCDARCIADGWTPVQARAMTSPIGNWSVIKMDGDTLQWAYLGLPLFTSKNETRSGELIGTTRREYQWLKPIMYDLPALQGVFN